MRSTNAKILIFRLDGFVIGLFLVVWIVRGWNIVVMWLCALNFLSQNVMDSKRGMDNG